MLSFQNFCRPFVPVRLFVASAALLAFSASVSKADGELTLELPPSQAAQELRAASQPQQASAPIPYNGLKHKAPPKRSRYASRGGNTRRQAQQPVGTLGALLANTQIYRERSKNSAILTNANAGTYVALRGLIDGWYGVLMADGTTGWVAQSVIKPMSYEVVSTGANRPTGEDASDIYPRSQNPYFQGDANALINEAYRYLGVRYVWGGNTANGIDCSGLVKNVFGTQGYRLPRLGSDQMAYGIPVPKNQLQPGDRLYFGRRTNRVGITHTGIYIGNGYFIHASSSRHGVAISHLSEALFQRIYVCARR